MCKLAARAAWKLALYLSAAGWAAGAISTAWAVDASHATPALPPTDVPANAGNAPASSTDDSLLPGRTDVANSDDSKLGPLYINHTAGIQFHVPRGSRKVLQVSQDILAEFDDPARKWELKVAMLSRDKATVLTTDPNLNPTAAAKKVTDTNIADEGLMEQTLFSLNRSLPAATVLRKDLTSLPNGNEAIQNDVGLITIRYSAAGERRLAQQALIQASDRLFYVLTLTSPAKPDDKPGPNDPREVDAVTTFRQMLDSVSLLDRTAVFRDQENRLFNARAEMVNFTPLRLRAALIPEQWFRIVRDGKDIGYTYVCEQQAGDIPRLGQDVPKDIKDNSRTKSVEMHKTPAAVIHPGNDILIGIRSTTLDQAMRSDKTMGPVRVDTEAWYFTSAQLNHEEWSREVLINDDTRKKPEFREELGTSNKRLKEVLIPLPPDAPLGTKQQMETQVDYNLSVAQVNAGAALPPINRDDLPPFYVSQAVNYLLPDLLPLHTPQGYMFRTYIGDVREVMMRYIDVQPQQAVAILGKNQFAVPIDDRIGLDGSVTTHYYSPKGKFLGSEDKDNNIWVIPTDPDTLQRIWSNTANLTAPRAVQQNHSQASAQPENRGAGN